MFHVTSAARLLHVVHAWNCGVQSVDDAVWCTAALAGQMSVHCEQICSWCLHSACVVLYKLSVHNVEVTLHKQAFTLVPWSLYICINTFGDVLLLRLGNLSH